MMLPFKTGNFVGGTERRNFSDAVALANVPDNKVFFTVVGPKESIPSVHDGVRLIRLHDEGKEVATCTPRQWQSHVMKRMDSFIEKFDIDVVQYGCNSHFWLAKQLLIKHGIPLNIFIGNYLSNNLLYDTGRCQDLYLLKSHGATFVFNTKTCERNFHDQVENVVMKLVERDEVPNNFKVPLKSKKHRLLTSHINMNNMGWGAVGNKSLRNVSEQDEEPFAIIAARMDPQKKLHLFTGVKFPLHIFIKNRTGSDKGGYGERLLSKMAKNPNITVHLDRPYDEIMDHFRRASLTIVSWPDETFGLTGFESASFGVPCAVFKKDKNDLNATEEFLSRLQSEDSPPVLHPINYADKDWKSNLHKAFKSATKNSLSDRKNAAEQCKRTYSNSAYVDERMYAINLAITNK